MKSPKIYIFFVFALLFCQATLFGQVVKTAEDTDLEFQTHFFEALKHKAIRNYQKALESLELCYELDSANTAVHFEFSKNYLMLSQYYEATMFIDMALKKDANSLYFLEHKRDIFQAQQNLTKAIEIQKQIVALNPKRADELVALFILNKDYEAAEKAIIDIENKGISTGSLREHRNFLRNRMIPKDKGKVITATDEELDQKKTIDELKQQFAEQADYQILVRLLTLLKEAERMEELNIQSTLGLELYPAQPQLYSFNGIALNRLGKYKEAIDVLTIGIDFVINNDKLKTVFYNEIALGYSELGDREKAAEFIKKAEVLRIKSE